jgi:hypothetical protein
MKREENQTVEYKESWHEKYLEWICGYANAKGGTLYIGIEDGTKKPVGVKNANKLMEDRTAELLKALHIRDRNYFREGYIRPTLRAGFIEQTKPEVKHSKLQKYRLTDKGRAALSANEHK